MMSRGFAGAFLALAAVACSSSEGRERPWSNSYPSYTAAPAPGFEPTWMDAPAEQVTVAGRLEGELRGIALSSDTTENVGYLVVAEDGSGTLSVNIAALGDGGAGMLIVSLADPALDEKLTEGHWSSLETVDPLDSLLPSSVSACAGPTIGDWPDEVASTDYEIDASEDVEQPGTVVVAVKAQFPVMGYEGTPTSELLGTIRFERATNHVH